MKIKLVILLFCLVALESEAQTTRWYSYADYLANDTSTAYTILYLWNDTTATFGYSAPSPSYSGNNFTSAGMSFAPVLPAWNNVPFYGSTIKVGPNDIYTIDSVRIYGNYSRNNAKPLPKDTLRLGFVYGNGAGTTNLPDYYTVGLANLIDYGYDTVNFPEMAHDSLTNTADKFTGVVTSPYIQSIELAVADTSSSFDRAYALATPFTVPAGNIASMSLTFKSGDASYTPFDTVVYASGGYKYGEFSPLVTFVENSGSAVFAPYSPIDTNVGFFKQEGYADVEFAGLYTPTWSWYSSATPSGAAYLQYPVVDFHITCPTCDLNDSIAGTLSVCAGGTSPLTFSLSGGTWSSSSAATATISGTGTVMGVAAGTVTITYTLSGHHAYSTFTVNPNPSAIGGSLHVCVGATTMLTEAIGPGTWASGSTSVAAIDGSGDVSGGTPGTTVITYTLGTGCSITAIETVNPDPVAIMGAAAVCVTHTTTLTDATTDGTWSSGSGSIATVGAGTGVVSGVAAGSSNITYTIASGCYATTLVTVETTPVAGTITGESTVCPGATISLADGVAGGAWSSSATAIANVNSVGLVSGVAGGSVDISYTVTNSCGTANTSYSVTVAPAPDAGVIMTASDSVCEGSMITLGDTATGGSWSSSNTLAETVDASGVVSGIAAGAGTISYTVSNSCGTVMATIPITVLSVIQCEELGTVVIGSHSSAELKVFPNPNHGSFAVSLLSNYNEQVNILITTILGEKVQEINTTTNKLGDFMLNMQQGIYILSATTSTGKYVAKLVVE